MEFCNAFGRGRRWGRELFLGIRLSRVISEGMFRRITLVLAIVTGSILLATTLRDTVAG